MAVDMLFEFDGFGLDPLRFGRRNSNLSFANTEEFDSIMSIAEKLNTTDERLQSELQTVTLLMEERKESQSEGPDSSTLQENSQETSQNGSAQSAAVPTSVPTESFSSILPKALSAVLHLTHPGPNSDHRLSRHPGKHSPTHTHSPDLERLQTEMRDLRDQFHQMKNQHNKEMKLLMNELDEEKRIRLTLQMEIQRMKKHMSK